MIMFVQLQFDQEARRAMILQIGHFKDNVIFCRWIDEKERERVERSAKRARPHERDFQAVEYGYSKLSVYLHHLDGSGVCNAPALFPCQVI